MSAEEPGRTSTKSAFREIVETILVTLLIYFLVRTFLFENYRVVGNSMMPTLENDQYLVVSKLEYRLHKPQRGDIVVFHDPSGSDKKLIKRVIGLPGEMLEITNGQVYINGQLLPEEYIERPGLTSRIATPIPTGHYFVLGDNRNNSSDSRNWGPLPQEELVGKAWVCYWPPKLWGVIASEAYGDGE